MGLKGATMAVATSIKNKNGLTIRFFDKNYHVQVDDNGRWEGSKPGTVNIAAKGATTITKTLEVELKEMGKNALDYIWKVCRVGVVLLEQHRC